MYHYFVTEFAFQIRSAGDAAQTLSWHSLAVVRGSYGSDDCVNEVAEIKFDRPVAIKVLFGVVISGPFH